MLETPKYKKTQRARHTRALQPFVLLVSCPQLSTVTAQKVFLRFAPSRIYSPSSSLGSMKLNLSAILLSSLCVCAVAQIGPKASSCKSSFAFVYTDKLGNKYESVQGNQLKKIQQQLSKKVHGSVCIVDEGSPDYIFDVHAYGKTRVVSGTEYPYTEYVLEIHTGNTPFELVHTFSRATRLGRGSDSESPIVVLVEDAATWLSLHPAG